jgi:UDP-N-acetylmuramoyl-L-alanyl-D-glutamate--2,6-diaminopimelate ligase
MRFSKLLSLAAVPHERLGRDVEVTNVTDDSRKCRVGSCFVAVRGCDADGHVHIASALAAGASAVICEDASAALRKHPCAIVASTRLACGPVAQAMLGMPARKLTTVGITGTNGKTTTACLVREMLSAAGRRCSLLGTISYDSGLRNVPATTTTPGPVELAELTAEMVSSGSTHLAMEVSSHALDQDRIAGVGFDVAVFTNLSGDHLDYHHTMESYLAAKAKLFSQLRSGGLAVVNRDDRAWAAVVPAGAEVMWYSLNGGADLTAAIESATAAGTVFRLTGVGESTAVSTPLIGRHNVYNCLAAAGAAMALGVDLPTIAAALASVSCVAGRLQRVGAEAPYAVFVDYAHTDDALASVLKALRPLCGSGRLIVVFGCGGDRDRTKRPRMGKVAEELADLVFVTSDNPRTEDAGRIIDDILEGLSPAGRRAAHVQGDRREAIGLAIAAAREGDVVLIAGKGHENYQIIGRTRREFDDVQVAHQAMAAMEAR